MGHPKNLNINDFNYPLLDEQIARFPLEKREQSRLLIYKAGNISEDTYANIASCLPAGALLAFNNSKVLEARLLFEKPTGGVIEVFLLEPHFRYHSPGDAIQQQGEVEWKCLIGGASKWKHGQLLMLRKSAGDTKFMLTARITGRSEDGFLVRFSWEPSTLHFGEILEHSGHIPIPPYLKREAGTLDSTRYQTVYADRKGSVAAPTAGLHFTDEIFASLQSKEIRTVFLTLHVGAGTFLPVKSETIEGHLMHAEFIEVDTILLQKLMQYGGKIFAVGTTSLRTLETIYRMGLKCLRNDKITYEDLSVTQWEVYDDPEGDSAGTDQVLEALLHWMQTKQLDRLIIKTSILIAPGYRVKMVSGLITNFHQPKSTLLLLVAALIGDDWEKVYEYALRNGMRFLSYGDGCLLHLR